MSFNAIIKRAQDHNRHINSRRVSVRSCIQLCLYYSGYNGYSSIVGYYNKEYKLNEDSLNSEIIDEILAELTELRENSKLKRIEYSNYRRNQKAIGRRLISKEDEAIGKENWENTNQIWNKFDTEENRIKKANLFLERRKLNL